MNFLDYIVFDFETGGLDIETLEPLQVAAMAIDARSLKSKGTFKSLMKPLDMNNLSQRALDVNKLKREDLEKAPDQATVWQEFAAFVKRFNKHGKPFTAPIPVGKNIRGFDLPISNRLCKTYKMVDGKGEQTLFNRRYTVDLEDFLFQWFENSNELPSYKFDDIRPYFGLSSEGAHDAMVDVEQTADLFVRFVKLIRTIRTKRVFKDGENRLMVEFRNACAKERVA